MRKNNRYRANLKGVYVDYEVNGLNLDHFISILKKRGVELYNIKKHSNKKLTLSVSLSKSEKFFAIGKELCYNVTKLGERGKGFPLLSLLRNSGIILGGIIFSLVLFYYSDIMFSVSYKGTGSIYQEEVAEFLDEKGVKKFSHFKDIDTKKLSYDILCSSRNFSFVNCYKEGNRLVIDLILSNKEKDSVKKHSEVLKAEKQGEITAIKVYKGNSKVNIGDTVNKGDILVEGVLKERGERDEVIATVSMRVTEKFTYKSRNSDEEEYALIFSHQDYYNKEDSFVETTLCDGIYYYEVTTTYICTLYS